MQPALSRPFPLALIITVGAGLVAAGLALALVPDPTMARALAIAVFCLALWLGEALPAFVPTLLLLALVPLAIDGPAYRLGAVMRWLADPVLLLFFGGFTLGIAAQVHGIDAAITSLALRWSGGHRVRLLGLVMLVSAGLSMWMSNTAAAAMILASLRPMINSLEKYDPFRSALLVGIAVATNIGGMGTPIGTVPNGIAIAALEKLHPISLLGWMLFGVPCMVVLLAVAFALLLLRYRISATALDISSVAVAAIRDRRAWTVVVVFALMVLGWLCEPLHGVSVPAVALIGAVVLFGSGLLAPKDLQRIDWSTLLLIAGGLGLGQLLQQSGCIEAATGAVDWQAMSTTLRMALLVGLAASMSAVMSNTATATVLIPLAFAIDPAPSTPIVVALACSLGMPFAISTPPNAMVYGEGLRPSDLLLPGVVFMVLGVLLTVLAAPWIF